MRKFIQIVYVIALVLTSLSCDADLYTSAIVDLSDKNPSRPKVEFSGETPSYFRVSSGEYYDRIDVSWRAVEGADFYEVQRRTPGGEWSTFPIQDTRFVDKLSEHPYLNRESSYEYRVRACSFDKAGGFTSVKTGRVLNAPGHVKATKGTETGRIIIEWDHADGADSYIIYRVTDDGNLFLDRTNNNRVVLNCGETEDGKIMKFRVTSRNGRCETPVEDAHAVIGYSKVFGAPGQPQEVEESEALSVSKPFTLSWKEDSNAERYKISRKGEHSAASSVFDNKSELLEHRDGRVYFTDLKSPAECSAGEKYTYSIIPEGKDKKGKPCLGQAAEADAWWVSLPAEKSISLENRKTDFIFSFDQGLGFETAAARKAHPDWRYEVICLSADGSYEDSVLLNPADFGDRVEYVKEWDNNPGHICCVYKVRIVNVNDESERTGYSDQRAILKPETPDTLTVSRNMLEGEPNEFGVYPVRISWTVPENLKSVRPVRLTADGQIDESVELKSDGLSCVDRNADAKAGEVFMYSLVGVDYFGRESDIADPSTLSEPERSRISGYGAITPDTFIRCYMCYVANPWDVRFENERLGFKLTSEQRKKWNSSKIKSYIDAGGISSLGSATDNCSFKHNNKSGSMHYEAKTEGFGGKITFSFDNFGECPYMYAEGGKYVMHCNASKNGSVENTTVKVGGMYPAALKYSGINVESAVLTGTYTLEYENGREIETVSAPSPN